MSVTAQGAKTRITKHMFCSGPKHSQAAREGSRKKEDQMLKIRLQGTPNDIKWFKKILERDKRIQLNDFSEMFANKGTNRYFRVYAEVEKSERAKTREKISRETKAERRMRLEDYQ